MSATVAALYVDPLGPYYGRPDIDPWDEARDARRYAGPLPVIAHPPCSLWSNLAPIIQARYGYKIGADGGCFNAALDAVRRWGGGIGAPRRLAGMGRLRPRATCCRRVDAKPFR